MPRKPFPTILALALCLASWSRAATIIWVSDNQNAINGAAADQGWVDLLRAQGYSVDYRGENDKSPDYHYWRTLDAGKPDELNAADLIIVSRDTSSGSYDDNGEPTLWNSVTTPLILQAAHLNRSNRWRWIDSTSTSGTTANMLAVLPEHPVFNGIALDANNEVEVINISTNVGDDNVSSDNNYTLIATRSDSDADGVWIAEWETGAEYYRGSGQFAGGPRMYFAVGGQGDVEDGQYNLTAEGEKLFLNVVRYMLGSFNPAAARTPYPADKSTVDLADTTPLRWGTGETAVRHDVYFAAVFDDVNSAEASDTTGVYRGRQDSVVYALPETLELDLAYYWRIDEVEADDTTVHRGTVWSFTVAEYLTVDDFEDYNDYTPDEIWSAWMDGFQIATNGSTVGYPNPDFAAGEHIAETQIVHGGKQAMPFFYGNDDQAIFSEAKMTLDFPRDWTTQGVRALSLWFRGRQPPLGAFSEGQDIGLLSNDAQPMYVAVSNDNGTTATVYHEDPNAAIMNAWAEWNIDLKDFTDQSIDLTDVNSIAIGFGNRNDPQAGGSGVVYFDDIRLYRPRYIPDKVTPLAADFTGDGLVDFRDLEILSNNWLKGDSFETGLLTHTAFNEASGDTVDFRDFAVLADEWLKELLWPEQ